jgi:four helix bundle protein
VAFQHRQLQVYAKAIQAVALVARITMTIASLDRWLAVQIRRAAGSIVLNIAEGAGEFSREEKAKFYRYARRSALEVSAGLDLVAVYGKADAKTIEKLQSLLDEIAAMLTAIVKRLHDDAKASRNHSRSRSRS